MKAAKERRVSKKSLISLSSLRSLAAISGISFVAQAKELAAVGFSIPVAITLCVSCGQQSPTGGSSVSTEDRARLDGLRLQVKQLDETSKKLAARLEKQSTTLETLNALRDTYDKRAEKIRDELSRQTNSLNYIVQYFSDQLAGQQAAISNVAWQVFRLDLKSSDNSAVVFDAANSTGFLRINTESGFFLVSLKNVEPYLEGYRVTLEIGNPLSADYEGLSFHVSWGRKFDAQAQFAANNTNIVENVGETIRSIQDSLQRWQNSLHSKDISVADKLGAGSWNKIQLVLAPAKSDELGYISIKLTTKTASLRRPIVP